MLFDFVTIMIGLVIVHGLMVIFNAHRNQGQDTNHHDIALIRVNGRIEFSDKVTPVNFPPASFDIETDGECE